MKIKTWMIVFAGMLLAAALRVYPFKELNSGSLYFGEVQTMADAALPVSEIASGIIKDQMPLKYYLLHAILYLGRDEFLLRFPALFFSLASIPLLCCLGTLLFDRKTALWTAFLTAVSMWDIHYAASAKNYPLYVFFNIVTTIFLYLAVQKNKVRYWVLFTAASVCSFYTFLSALFVLAAQTCWVFLCFHRHRELIRRLLISLGCFAVMIVPWGHRLIFTLQRKQEFGIGGSGLQGHEILSAVRDHFGGMAGPFPFGIFVFFISVVWLFWFREKKQQAILLSLLVMLPVGFYVFFHYIFHASVVPRYFFPLYPFFLLMAAAGIASWRHWAWKLAGAAAFFLPLCLYGLAQAGVIRDEHIPCDYLHHNEDFAAVAALIEKNRHVLDFVVIESYPAILGIQYYMDKSNRSPLVALKRKEDPDWYWMYDGPGIIMYGADGNLPLLRDLAAAGRLLVADAGHLNDFDDGRDIAAWLQSNAYRVEKGYDFNFYFISPPRGVFGDYKNFSEKTRRKILSESCVLRRLIYPFNKEWDGHQNQL